MNERWLSAVVVLAMACGGDDGRGNNDMARRETDVPSHDAAPNNATPNNATPNNTTPNNATPNNATPNNATPNNATPNNATPTFGEWVELFGGTDADIVEDVAADDSGNVYITGTFRDTMTIAETTLVAAEGEVDPTNDVFVASFAPDGAFRWATSFGSPGNEKPFGIATDGAGNVFVVGDSQGDLSFGSSTLPSKGQGDLFAVKYDANGEYQWAQSWGGMYTESARDIDVNEAGDLFITGSWQGLFTAGDQTYSAATDWSAMEVLVLAIDGNSGAVKWSNSYDGFLIDTGTSIAADSAGNVAVAVSFQYDLDIEGTTFEVGEPFNVAIVKLDPDGALQWVEHLAVEESAEVTGIELAKDGAVYATGVFSGTVNFGGADLVNPVRGHDVFLLALDGDGNHVYSASYGGEGFDQPLDMTMRGDVLYVTGRFDGEIAFGESVLRSSSDVYDIFVASFETSTGAVRWARGFGGPLDDQANGIAVDPWHGVYVAGYGDGGDFMFNDVMQPAASEWVDAVVFRLEED